MIRSKVLVHEAKKAGYEKPHLSNPKIEIHCYNAGREVLKINPPDRDGTITRANTQYLPLQTIITEFFVVCKD
ncbi:MAG: hypothetical protein ACMUHX_11785 [bacterium]